MSQQIAHFKVAAGLKWSREVEGEGLRENLLKACQHYTMRVCVHVCACLVESYCALCECACRALSQVGEVEKAAEKAGGRAGEAFCQRSYGIESICDTAWDECTRQRQLQFNINGF